MTLNIPQKQLKIQNGNFINGPVCHLIPSAVQLSEDRKTLKQAASEGGCSEGLAKHLDRGNGKYGAKTVFVPVLQIIVVFTVLSLCAKY